MLKKRVATLLMGTILVGSLAVGCGSKEEANGGANEEAKITVSGSTSVGPAMEMVAEAYKGVKENVSIEIQQIGSSAGIKNAIEGVSEIGMASRDLKDEEKASGIKEEKIAIDAIALILNKNNEVKDLTPEQIKGIYTGKITNWKEVGGKDAPIVVVSREDGSGTRGAFEEIVGFEGELTADAQIGDGSGNIKATVEGNENAIGYISASYVDEAVSQITVNGEELTVENVKAGKYPVARPFLLVYNEEKASEEAKALLDFILTEEGQAIMEEEGLISVN